MIDSLNPSDEDLMAILTTTKTIAMVGASNKQRRASYQVFNYMQTNGYDITPINPVLEGQEILSKKVLSSLGGIDHSIDMVDVFRASDQMDEVISDILTLKTLPKYIWMQIGVINEGAAELAQQNGIEVIMNRCPKIEHMRLLS